MALNRIVVFDFDGTLLNCNSFHKWIAFSFLYFLSKVRLARCISIIYWMMQRKLNNISHSIMKNKILHITSCIDGHSMQKFVDLLFRYIIPRVYEELNERVGREGCDVLIVTAAPKNYVAEFSKRLDSVKFIATEMNIDNPDWMENIGEEKVASLARHYSIEKSQLDIYEIYSDHHDDLPLFLKSENVFLVNPSEKTKSILSEALNKVSVLV